MWAALMAVVALVVLVLVVGGYYQGRWTWDGTGFEGASLWDWMQLLVIPAAVVIGTFVLNQTAKRRERDAEQRAREQALQREFHQELSQAYNTGKKVRRLLRVVDRSGRIKREDPQFHRLMEELVTTQLRFELLAEQASIRFPGAVGRNIESKLERVEKYMNKIVNEYEKGPSKKGNVKFPLLREFITKEEESGFRKWRAYYSAPTHKVSDQVLLFLKSDTAAAERSQQPSLH